jgi:hypothetical protein
MRTMTMLGLVLIGMVAAVHGETVRACANSRSGRVRFLADATLECRRSERAVDFDTEGTPGARGATGDPGAAGATGPAGPQGPAGRSALTPLQSGESVSGVWGAAVTAAGAGEGYRAFATFPIPLAADIAPANRVYVSGASAPNCPGMGQAATGYLCVYQGYVSNATTPVDGNIFNPAEAGGPGGASRYGFSIFLSSANAGLSNVSGTFTVKAP